MSLWSRPASRDPSGPNIENGGQSPTTSGPFPRQQQVTHRFFYAFTGSPSRARGSESPEYGVRSEVSLLSHRRRAGCAVHGTTRRPQETERAEVSAWGLGRKLKSVGGVVVSMRWSGENWNALGSSHLDTTSSQLPAVIDNCHCPLFLNCAHAGVPETRPANCKP